jgi:hypothetical protein
VIHLESGQIIAFAWTLSRGDAPSPAASLPVARRSGPVGSAVRGVETAGDPIGLHRCPLRAGASPSARPSAPWKTAGDPIGLHRCPLRAGASPSARPSAPWKTADPIVSEAAHEAPERARRLGRPASRRGKTAPPRLC